jgi:acetyltransferase-like isoleucine patch superfamily enzyme
MKIGAFCSISDGVTIFLGGNHRIDWLTTYPFPVFRESAKQFEGHPATRGDVVIGSDVWIGYGATIMSGVEIGNGAVVGAQAVVTKSVPPYTVVAGNPAKVIRTRFPQEDVDVLQELAWWNWADEKIDQAMPFLLSGNIPGLKSFSQTYDPKISATRL